MTDEARAETPLIELRGVTKTYTNGDLSTQVLHGVDLKIYSGEFVAIVGASGSGKSTLMNIIGCLDRPTSGRYKFDGQDTSQLSRTQLAHIRNQKLGFVFQGFNLLARTSALENVELPLLYRRDPPKVRHARAMRALEQVGLAEWHDHTPSELSGGQQQRVAIARALVTEPELLLADEPTGNLDTQRSLEIMELLTGLNRARGITVIMVTHEPDIAAYARTRVHFRDGRVERVDAPAEAA